MRVGNLTALQILMAWRGNKWIVARNSVEVAAFAYRPHAMAYVRRLAAEAWREGFECYLLIRERDGRWEERPCGRSARR